MLEIVSFIISLIFLKIINLTLFWYPSSKTKTLLKIILFIIIYLFVYKTITNAQLIGEILQ
jgi:hypothetical protein